MPVSPPLWAGQDNRSRRPIATFQTLISDNTNSFPMTGLFICNLKTNTAGALAHWPGAWRLLYMTQRLSSDC
jgi:hypothetical protein